MAKKPNYDFEKRERERLKNEKKKARALEKTQGSTTDDTPPESASEVADSDKS